MDASGKFIVRVSPELHSKLRELSRSRGISLNELCRSRLAENILTVDRDQELLSAPLRKSILDLPLPIEGLVLFGSQVRGDATAASDTDLLIVLQSGTPISRDLYALWDEKLKQQRESIEALRLVPHFASFPASKGSAGSLWLEVSLNGNVLWEKESGTVKRFLLALREAIAEGRFQRKMSHGQPYWVRKDIDEK